MSISGQQQINVGLPNESANSDSLYTAFTKINENFDTVFSCASPYNTFAGGPGITASTNPSTGTVTITNSGVTNIVAGTNIVISSANGDVTISSTGGGGGGGGTVTSVGLQPVSVSRLVVANSPVISSGTISIDLALSGASSGTYSNPNVTVDSYGRITSIANGIAGGTVTSVGITAGPGIAVNGGPVTNSGNIVVTNSGVTKLTAGSGIVLSSSNGNVTVSVSGGVGTGTVTSVGVYSTSLDVTNSPITTSGSIQVEIPTNPVILGTLTAANANLGNNAAANYFTGNGSALTSITGANVTGQVANALIASRVYTNAQPNITSVGNLTSLVVTGNVSGGNASLGNLVAANFFSGSGQFLSALQAANISGTVATAANATRVATTLQSTGLYYVPFISATSTANYGLNANATFVANVSNGSFAATTIVGNLIGTVNTSSQPNITSVGNLTSLTVAGSTNIDSGTLFVDSSTNRVGVGTTLPAYLLDVGGAAVGSPSINLFGPSSDNNWGGRLRLSSFNSTSVNAAISTSTNGMFFEYGGSERVRIDSSGNVGIANTAPTHTLSVTGTINASGNANVGNLGATAGVFTGAVTGSTTLNITGNSNVGNLGTSGLITATGNVTGGNLTTGGRVVATGNVNGGNIIATANVSAVTLVGNLYSNNITTGSNATAGTITGNWSLSAGSKLQSTYADLAEYYEADDVYVWGTVLEFGGDKDVTVAANETTRVAGVVSKNPAYVMNATCPGLLTALALQGRVPCKVQGPTRKGDIMVSAGGGYAKACSAPLLGTVIGKALRDFDGVEGVVEIAVGRL